MYVPASFAETDPAALHGLIRANSFGLLVTAADGAPFASHLPFLLDAERGAQGTLMAHMARANPQWRSFAAGGVALAVFQGPHAYVSPAWYEASEKVVPTWNYAVVHAYGEPVFVEGGAATRAHLGRLLAEHEGTGPDAWRMESQPDDFLAAMSKGIVAFELPIERLEGKFKLSQNRPAGDVPRVIAALRETGDRQAHAVAEMMAAREG